MLKQRTILLVEDEPASAEMLSTFLEMHDFRVMVALDGNQAMELLRSHGAQVDLAILDIMVPGADGRQICTFIRQQPEIGNIPVIFLTAKDQEQDEILGLYLGADDYIPKPASLNLVLAHVNSLLRRRSTPDSGSLPSESFSASAPIRIAQVTYDPAETEVRLGAQRLELTATEIRLVGMFFRSPRRVFSRQEILEHIKEDDKHVFDRTVDVHVKNLRIKLGVQGNIIKTYRGIGYGIDRDQL
jgi:DNA-binding response OmpR family regulator